jgi:predicted phosphoribosyltransferase
MTTKHDQAPGRARNASIGAVSRLEMLAISLGGLVLAAIVAAKLGALATIPSQVVLAVVIPAFFLTALAAVRADGSQRRTPDRPGGSHADDAADIIEDDPPGQSEIEQVERWRHTRLAALGVADESAIILAAQRDFSVHEFERLLGSGCPPDTALRILEPV